MKKHETPPSKDFYEKSAWKNNRLVCGIDEVGRGCLAGPLTVACVVLPAKKPPTFLKDSKIVSSQDRNKAVLWIKKNCYYSVVSVDNYLIDTINIYQATLNAMQKATHQLISAYPHLVEKLDCIVVDAMPLTMPTVAQPIHHFIKGETYSSSIAAASLLAKETRDALLERLDLLFPAYTLKNHKGYATQCHTDALVSNGKSIIHRTEFVATVLSKKGNPDEQRKLFS